MKVLTDHILKLGLLPGYESEQNTIILRVETNKQTNKQTKQHERARAWGQPCCVWRRPGPIVHGRLRGDQPRAGSQRVPGRRAPPLPPRLAPPRPAPPRPLPKGLRCHGAGPGRAGPGGAVDAAPARPDEGRPERGPALLLSASRADGSGAVDSHSRSRQQREGMMQCFTVVLGSPCSSSAAVDQELVIENPEFSVFPSSRHWSDVSCKSRCRKQTFPKHVLRSSCFGSGGGEHKAHKHQM